MKRQILPILAALAAIPCVNASGNQGMPSEGSAPAAVQAPAKELKLAGVVIDENREPLPGATVVVRGTHIGVATDIDGQFMLVCPAKSQELVVSYVGYETVTFRIDPTSVSGIQIIMHPSANVMDEVVVTGYQNIKRENATGAFAVVKGDDLQKKTSSNIAEGLEGTLPGLVVKHEGPATTRTYSAYPNEEDKFVIRGVGTFSSGTAPLVVVDGLPIEGGLQTVNLYDIDTITVLKDASAAAIYGARASNGVIVVTTKQSKQEKLKVDFNIDLTLTDKVKYDKAGWATTAQLKELERLNWNALLNEDGQTQLNSLLADYASGRSIPSPINEMYIRNYLGEVSDAELNSYLGGLGSNNYRKEWQDLREKTGLLQQYNVSIRTSGNKLASSVTANYTRDNMGFARDYNSQLQFRYKGDLKVAKWLDLSFSFNILNQRQKQDINGDYTLSGINSYRPYESMYNEDGSLNRMKGTVNLNNPAFENPEFELKDHTFNMAEEVGMSRSKSRYTNIRSYIHGLFRLPVEGWTASAMFQYEDINSSNNQLYGADSYYCRDMFNRLTTYNVEKQWVEDWANFDFETWDWNMDHYGKVEKELAMLKHNFPDGAVYLTSNSHSAFYTFRVQTDYSRKFADKHDVNVLAGFEYRDMHTSGNSDTFLGYNPTTLTNQNTKVDWMFLTNWGSAGVLGSQYTATAPSNFYTSDSLHRYYSYYITGNYMFDSRYSVFGSFRVDRTDLFGSDPKFRGRPLWSAGLSWNLSNEKFMRDITLLNMLKLRASYGLTGNIRADVKSILTARLENNPLNGKPSGVIQTPPNDQLRWEKTATWNAGVDFSLFNYRLNGSIDYYHKRGSDLLCNVLLDVTTGWAEQVLNAGKMTNQGFEIQLNGNVIEQLNRKQFGLNIGANFGYNHNKVTKVFEKPVTGNDFRTMSLKEGYPLNSIMGIDFAGLQYVDGICQGTWRGKDGEVHNTVLSNPDFTMEDCIFVGTTTPKWNGGFTIEPRWYGFSLNANFNFYGGHYMNCDNRIYDTYYGSAAGFEGNTPVTALDFWNGVENAIPNGMYEKYNDRQQTYRLAGNDFRNYERADYLKLRSLGLSYDFERSLVKKIGFSDIRLRVQMNNVFTIARNSRNWDPEGFTLSNSIRMSQPRSYSFSLFFSL